jgi:hypothetical protein
MRSELLQPLNWGFVGSEEPPALTGQRYEINGIKRMENEAIC